MQMTADARAWLDAALRRILARYTVGDPERAGVTYEIMSHLHGAAEAHALRAGREVVTVEDLERALADAGGEETLAGAFVQPLSRPTERVLFWRRLGAFIIDVVLLGVIVSFVHGAVTFLFAPLAGQIVQRPHDQDLWAFMPWGFHDPSMPFVLQAAVAVASALVVLGYFTWLEAHEGRSLGKRALGLRVVRVDGRPMTYREAFLRNLVKLSPLALFLDVVVMLLFLRGDKQRVSDKIAETIVVRA